MMMVDDGEMEVSGKIHVNCRHLMDEEGAMEAAWARKSGHTPAQATGEGRPSRSINLR